jgi:hypothetical protein
MICALPVPRQPHSDVRMHQGPAVFGGHDTRLDGCLPLVELLLGLRKLHHVVGGVFEKQPRSATSTLLKILPIRQS